MYMEQTLGPVGPPSHCDGSDDQPSLEILSIHVLQVHSILTFAHRCLTF